MEMEAVEECGICFYEYNDTSRRPVMTSCGHTLCSLCHRSCLQMSQLGGSTCPFCRKFESLANGTIRTRSIKGLFELKRTMKCCRSNCGTAIDSALKGFICLTCFDWNLVSVDDKRDEPLWDTELLSQKVVCESCILTHIRLHMARGDQETSHMSLAILKIRHGDELSDIIEYSLKNQVDYMKSAFVCHVFKLLARSGRMTISDASHSLHMLWKFSISNPKRKTDNYSLGVFLYFCELVGTLHEVLNLPCNTEKEFYERLQDILSEVKNLSTIAEQLFYENARKWRLWSTGIAELVAEVLVQCQKVSGSNFLDARFNNIGTALNMIKKLSLDDWVYSILRHAAREELNVLMQFEAQSRISTFDPFWRRLHSYRILLQTLLFQNPNI